MTDLNAIITRLSWPLNIGRTKYGFLGTEIYPINSIELDFITKLL